jgi:hypothetical protein
MAKKLMPLKSLPWTLALNGQFVQFGSRVGLTI